MHEELVYKMSVLVSNWCKNSKILPPNYIFPPDKRPGDIEIPINHAIPVIDLSLEKGQRRVDLLQQIISACHDFGMFQVINHGVPIKLMDDTMSMYEEFFDMPAEEKAKLYSEDLRKSCRLYTSGQNYTEDQTNFWKDTLKHPCYPVEDHIQSWPEKPDGYREVVAAYSLELRKLSLKVMDMIFEGLEIQVGCFGDDVMENQLLVIHHYPRCPDPSSALGLSGHWDPTLITILQQKVYGLQMLKDEEWIGVEPIAHAFVVNISDQLEVISNGKLKGAHHRAVTNSNIARTSIVTFIGPSAECVIEPAKALVSPNNPPLFKSFLFKEFYEKYMTKEKKNCGHTRALDCFRLQV